MQQYQGGVIIGALAGILTNPRASLIIGSFGGIVSSLGFYYLNDFLKNRVKLHDTAGVHNFHDIPGILVGLISAAVIAAYNSDPIDNLNERSFLTFYTNSYPGRSFIGQGAIQVAGTFAPLEISILFGILAGLLMTIFYRNYSATEFYNDYYNFEQLAVLQ